MPKKRCFVLVLTSVLTILGAGCTPGTRDLLDKGNRFFESGRYKDAEIQYRKALQTDTNNGEVYYRLGLVQTQQLQGAEAYGSLSRAVELMPDNEAAKAKLADLTLAAYVADPRRPAFLHDQLEKLAQQLIQKNAGSVEGLRLMASLRLIERKPEDALVFYEKAYRADPRRPDVIHGYVQALFLQNRFPQAEQMALQAIETHKEFSPIYDVLYGQYVVSKRFDAAEGILKTKIRNNPAQANYVLQLAEHYRQARKPAEMTNVLTGLLNDSQIPNRHFAVGDFYVKIGNLESALGVYEEGARTDSARKIDYQKRVVETLTAQGKQAEAVAKVEAFLKDNPGDMDGRSLRARLLLDSGTADHVAKARVELQDVVTSNPDNPRFRSLLAKAHLANHDMIAAEREFQQVLKLQSRDVPARLALGAISLKKQRPQEAVRYADEVLTIDSANGAANRMRVTAMIASGSYGEARQALKRLALEDPKSAEVQFQFGLLASAEKKGNEAASIFQELHEKKPADDQILSALVQSYIGQNRVDKALDLATVEAKKRPDSTEVQHLLATVAVQARQYDLAAAQYERLLTLRPAAIEFRMELAEVYRLKGDLDKGIAVLQKVQQMAPKDPGAAMMLGSMLATAGRTSEAKGRYQRVNELRPDNPFAMNNVAFLAAETGGNLDDALRLVQQALVSAPSHPVLMDTLAWIYVKKGRNDAAASILTELVREQPSDPVLHYHLAAAEFGRGQKQRARLEVQKGLALQPPSDLAAKFNALLDSPTNR